jgi:nucleoside-diphosphate-sugar epimerase
MTDATLVIQLSSFSILITGASGFIGRALCAELPKHDYSVIAATRDTNLETALSGVSCVIHCAGRAHVINETSADSLAAYRAVNVDGTRRLAKQAVAAGVKRLVFLSSIGVNGIFTSDPQRFTATDKPNPVEPYAISKWQGEEALWEVSAKTGLEVVAVRPPLVYGPGVKGNLARLLPLIHRGLPLPFGGMHNRRSLVGLDNLVDLLICCVDHPAAAGKTFLVSDQRDLSTTELFQLIAKAMGRPARLFSVPQGFLRFAGKLTGKLSEIDRLLGSLMIDDSLTRQTLGYAPKTSVDEGIQKMVNAWLATQPKQQRLQA